MELKNIKELVEPILKKHDTFLYELTFVKENNEDYLRIFVDKVGASLDLDTCVAISEEISLLLDEKDLIPHEYILEVSSAGAERPLKNIEDYKNALEKDIWVVLKEPIDKFDEIIGVLKEATETGIILEYKFKTKTKKVEILFENIEEAITTVRF